MNKKFPGTQAWFEQLLEEVGSPGHDRKMFRFGITATLVSTATGMWSAAMIDSAWLRVPLVGLNMLLAATNAMLAGKWARRMEEGWERRMFGGERFGRPWEN